MPNVLDMAPLRALASRASAKIADKTVARRYERLAATRLLRDPRNFRSVNEDELASAPAWARAAHARGELSAFSANKSIAARLHMVARRIDQTCRLAAADQTKSPRHAAAITSARRFLTKFGRVNFDIAARKSLDFSRLLASLEEDLDTHAACPGQTLVLLGGRVWHRITSVAELRKIGSEFRNCLAHTTATGGYGGRLIQGEAQFWVLRGLDGAGLIVAMAPAPEATHFVEVKGPRNAHVSADHPDLVQLGIAIGVKPPPPTPPAPSAFGVTPAGLISLLERFDRPCLDPRDRRFALVRLRQRGRAY